MPLPAARPHNAPPLGSSPPKGLHAALHGIKNHLENHRKVGLGIRIGRTLRLACCLVGCAEAEDRSSYGRATAPMDASGAAVAAMVEPTPTSTAGQSDATETGSLVPPGLSGEPTTPNANPAGDSSGGPGFVVPADSAVCSADLPFKPPGCPCTVGAPSAPCWTGPPDQRHTGDCKDGVQTCSDDGEFSSWGACEGEVLSCGAPPEPPPQPQPPKGECPCVPGVAIGCDEDCEAFVICKPFSSKVCQPDGRFGPCRETLLPTPDSQLLGIGCVNLFHGCFPANPEGTFTGDCSGAFTCGHPPGGNGLLPLPL